MLRCLYAPSSIANDSIQQFCYFASRMLVRNKYPFPRSLTWYSLASDFRSILHPSVDSDTSSPTCIGSDKNWAYISNWSSIISSSSNEVAIRFVTLLLDGLTLVPSTLPYNCSNVLKLSSSGCFCLQQMNDWSKWTIYRVWGIGESRLTILFWGLSV